MSGKEERRSSRISAGGRFKDSETNTKAEKEREDATDRQRERERGSVLSVRIGLAVKKYDFALYLINLCHVA